MAHRRLVQSVSRCTSSGRRTLSTHKTAGQVRNTQSRTARNLPARGAARQAPARRCNAPAVSSSISCHKSHRLSCTRSFSDSMEHEPPVSLTKLIKREVELVKEDMPTEIPPPPGEFKLVDERGLNYFLLEKMGSGGEKVVVRCEFVPPPPEPYDVDAAFGEWASTNPDQVKGMLEQNPVLPPGVKLETHERLLSELGVDVSTLQQNESDEPEGMGDMNQERSAQFQVHISKGAEKGAPTMVFHLAGSETGIDDIGSVAIIESGHPGIKEVTGNQDYEFAQKYLGPRFEDFDDDMKAAWSGYLMRRGIDNEMATWLFNYAQYKESVEYMSFLNKSYKFLKM